MKNQIRNIAVSGVDTVEKYRRVCKLCVSEPLSELGWGRHNEIVHDCGNTTLFMNDWHEQNFSHCTLYTYEDFIAKYDKEVVTDFTNTYCVASELHYDYLVLDIQFYVKKLRIETTGYYLINNDKDGESIWFNSYDAMVKQFKPRQIEYNEDLNNWVYVKPIQEVTPEMREEADEEFFSSKVYKITNSLAEMLIDKNKKYGNSALEPKRIFSNASPVEQILVRIDDKLSRMSNQNEDEDVVEDLLGYLVLLKIAKQQGKK